MALCGVFPGDKSRMCSPPLKNVYENERGGMCVHAPLFGVCDLFDPKTSLSIQGKGSLYVFHVRVKGAPSVVCSKVCFTIRLFDEIGRYVFEWWLNRIRIAFGWIFR